MAESYLSQQLAGSLSKDRWQEVGFFKRAGVLVPLFSVYSKNSYGIGDLGDLLKIIDWAKRTQHSIVQLLPMNEVGALFCPYDALSSFALEPAYIDLNAFPGLKGKKFKSARRENQFVDYALKQQKLKMLWEVFLAEDLTESVEFEAFQQKNSYWLLDFALFKILKEYHQGQAWQEWEEKYRDRHLESLQNFQKENIEKITFQMWLQWVIFKQFKAAQSYAAKNNIFLKGDLPVLVSRDSADVWAHVDFFKLEFAAGAPADMYCAKGQRWGMPTYNWDNIARNNYLYIKEKLRFAQEFYNILRIDHVVGLFRIWSISYYDDEENQGLNGVFDPAEENLWAVHGKKILKLLVENTKMLLCAEDLGVIPQSCRETLNEFGIAGNDVQRWVKDWNKRHDFLLPQEYRELSVAMLSTHDTTNWFAWWQYEAGTVDEGLFMRKCAQRGIDFQLIKSKLFNLQLSKHGRLRWKEEVKSIDKLLEGLGKSSAEVGDFIELYENTYAEKEKLWELLDCSGPLKEKGDKQLLSKMLKFVLSSQSIFCINLIGDLLSLTDIFKGDPYQYRLNVPGTISALNWSQRLPISIEDLLKHPVNKQIREMNIASGRI